MRNIFDGPEFLYAWLQTEGNGEVIKSLSNISVTSPWAVTIRDKRYSAYYLETNSQTHYDTMLRTNNSSDFTPLYSGKLILDEEETEDYKSFMISIAGTTCAYMIMSTGTAEIQIVRGIPSSNSYYPLYRDVIGAINYPVLNYLTAKKALGAGIADKYIAQPIVLGGVKTPLYSIVSNSTSADPDLFTEVAVDGQKFFVVDHGVGVKVD